MPLTDEDAGAYGIGCFGADEGTEARVVLKQAMAGFESTHTFLAWLLRDHRGVVPAFDHRGVATNDKRFKKAYVEIIYRKMRKTPCRFLSCIFYR